MTAGTLHKEKLFVGDERLTLLHDSLLEVSEELGWRLEAWAVFANHYHFVGRSPDAGSLLNKFSGKLHSITSWLLNRLDDAPGRKVWFSYHQTRLTYEKSYLARLAYVHSNPVKHGLVSEARLYKWCSASWFEQHAEPGWRDTVLRFRTDQVNVEDDF